MGKHCTANSGFYLRVASILLEHGAAATSIQGRPVFKGGLYSTKYGVHKEQDVEQKSTHLLQLKGVETGELQIVKEQLVQQNNKLQEEICLLKPGFLFNSRMQFVHSYNSAGKTRN